MAFLVRENSANETVYRFTREIPSKMERVFRRGMIDYMAALKKEANREILHGRKTGRAGYIRLPGRKRRKWHVSSAPFETHANRTGKLRRSLSWKVHSYSHAEFGYGVATTEADSAPRYAGFVEYGTKRMKPRPSLHNAVEKTDGERFFHAAFDAEFT